MKNMNKMVNVDHIIKNLVIVDIIGYFEKLTTQKMDYYMNKYKKLVNVAKKVIVEHIIIKTLLLGVLPSVFKTHNFWGVHIDQNISMRSTLTKIFQCSPQ